MGSFETNNVPPQWHWRNENSASLNGFLSNVRRSCVDLVFNIAVDFTSWAATEREFDGLVTWEWLGNAGSKKASTWSQSRFLDNIDSACVATAIVFWWTQKDPFDFSKIRLPASNCFQHDKGGCVFKELTECLKLIGWSSQYWSFRPLSSCYSNRFLNGLKKLLLYCSSCWFRRISNLLHSST